MSPLSGIMLVLQNTFQKICQSSQFDFFSAIVLITDSSKELISEPSPYYAKLTSLEETPSTTLHIPDNVAGTTITLRTEADIYFCEKVSGTCHRQGVAFEVPIHVESKEQTEMKTSTIELKHSFVL